MYNSMYGMSKKNANIPKNFSTKNATYSTNKWADRQVKLRQTRIYKKPKRGILIAFIPHMGLNKISNL